MIDDMINSVIKDDTLGEDDDSCKKLSSLHSCASNRLRSLAAGNVNRCKIGTIASGTR